MATLTNQDEYIKTALRLPRALHTAVQEAAESAGRSMNAEIIRRLELSLAPWGESDPDASTKSPIPDSARLKEMVGSLPPPKSEKDAIARQLALAVLRMTGRLSDEDLDFEASPPEAKTRMLDPLEALSEQTPTPSRTPEIPGVNSPKRGLGAGKTKLPKRASASRATPTKKKITD